MEYNRDTCASMYIHNSQVTEPANVSVNRWLDNENVLYAQRSLFSHQEGNDCGVFFFCGEMNGTRGHHIKRNKPDSKNKCMFSLIFSIICLYGMKLWARLSGKSKGAYWRDDREHKGGICGKYVQGNTQISVQSISFTFENIAKTMKMAINLL